MKKVSGNKFYWNRYPQLEYLAKKKVFSSAQNRMRRTFENEFDFAPISFLLPEESDQLQEYMSKKKDMTFICKPNSGKGGDGIFLVDNFKSIPRNLWSEQ